MNVFAKFGVLLALLLASTMPQAAQQTVTLPKGTTVQKLAPGHFRFKLPDGKMVELRNFNAKVGTVGDCKVLDASGRKLDGGMGCQFRSGPKPVIDPDPPYKPGTARPSSPNFVQIDDEVTWLPGTLTFQGRGLGDPDPPLRAKPGMDIPMQQKEMGRPAY